LGIDIFVEESDKYIEIKVQTIIPLTKVSAINAKHFIFKQFWAKTQEVKY
jgi:hypothetical protein